MDSNFCKQFDNTRSLPAEGTLHPNDFGAVWKIWVISAYLTKNILRLNPNLGMEGILANC